MAALPPFTWLRAFEAAARRLSFTAAAQELGLTQSAISQHIRHLELRLGVPLFERKPRGIALTDAGRRLLPGISGGFAGIEAALALFQPLGAATILQVTTSVSIAQSLIAPELAAFQAAHPGLRLRLSTAVWPDEFGGPAPGVQITFGNAALAQAGAQPLVADRLIVVAAPGRCDGPRIQAVGTNDHWRRWAAQTGTEAGPEPALLVDSHGLAVLLASHGAGVALTSALIAAPLLASGRLIRCDAHDIAAEDGYYLRADDSPAAQLFAQWLRGRAEAALAAALKASPAAPPG